MDPEPARSSGTPRRVAPRVGDDVVVVLRVAARGTGSGVPIAQQRVWLWTFRDGRAVRAKAFRSKREALEAVGLAE